MANGLLCTEQLVSSTPKYRHGSNSENTPPQYTQYSTDLKPYNQLMCQETIDDSSILKPIQNKPIFESFQHPPVKADCDTIILRDDRVIQNLLKNEER